MKKEKQVDIELMRIIAVFFVLFNHSGESGFTVYSQCNLNSVGFWISRVLSGMCTLAVPLFYMITGALMLSKEPPALKKLWGEKIPKMVFILLFWSFFYYLREVYKGWAVFGMREFLIGCYESEWLVPLWYLYSYIPLLMSIPVLYRLANGLSNKEFLYTIALVLFFEDIQPTVEYLLWEGGHTLNGSFNLHWLCSSILIYPCLGYFLHTRAKDYWDGKKLGLLWVADLFVLLLSSYLTFKEAYLTGAPASDRFLKQFTLVNAATVFVTCQYCMNRFTPAEWIKKCIISMGGATFGIYVLHIFVMRMYDVVDVYGYLIGGLPLPQLLLGLLYCLIIFLGGYLLTVVLKRIPLLRKTLC